MLIFRYLIMFFCYSMLIVCFFNNFFSLDDDLCLLFVFLYLFDGDWEIGRGQTSGKEEDGKHIHLTYEWHM